MVNNSPEKLHGKRKERCTLQDDFETKEGHSKAGKLLKECAWLYDKEKNRKPTGDMELSDLHEQYEVNESNKPKLEKALGFNPEHFTAEQVREKMAEKDKEIEALKEEGAEKDKENEGLKERIKELEGKQSPKPTQKPIDTSDVNPVTQPFSPNTDRPTGLGGGRRPSTQTGGTETAENGDLEPNKEIGRAGEELADKWLTTKFPDAEVIWENRDGEKGIGYDFEVKEPGAPNKFYEVKATASKNQTEFLITRPQWEKAQEAGDNYYILLIKEVGENEQPPVTPICNPVQKAEAGEIKVRAYKVSL